MNICYINPTNNIRRPIAELANILSKQGHNITILYPESKRCPTKNWIANDITKNPNIKTIPINSYYIKPLRYNLPNLFQLIKQTKKLYKTNHKIHIWEYYYPLSIIPLLYASLKRSRKNKTILTTDGFVGYSYKPKYLSTIFRLYTQTFAQLLFRIPKTITTYGKAMLPYAKQAGMPMSKLKIIPTGIHLDRFKNIKKEKITKLKEEFNIKDEKIILFVGMLTERKGLSKVIKISQRLLKENHNIKTLIVGDAHGKNIYKRLIKPKYQNKIIFTGGRKDIPELMRLSHSLLLPSEGEGLPGVVMEAMACGLPVVATNEGCTPDLIEKQLLAKTNREYYIALKNILNNKNNSSKNNFNKIKNYGWRNISKKYKALYQLR